MKKKGADPAAVSKARESMTEKKSRRLKQSEADRATSQAVEGWTPSARRKEAVEFKHRCSKCLHPSADVRRGAKVCDRCASSSTRREKANAARSQSVAVKS